MHSVGWSQSDTYNNVAISFDVWDLLSAGVSVEGYLTNQIGPGTTVLNELTPSVTVQIAPGYPASPTVFFSGLTLGPGNYWVSLRGNSVDWTFLGWGTPPTVVLASGVSLLGEGNANPSLFYAPADSIPIQGGGSNGITFQVTGDLAQGAAVPEPSTMALCLGGLLVLVGARLRRRSL